MTPRQKQYLLTIKKLSRKLGYPPTLTEIAHEMEVSFQATSEAIQRLKIQGFITQKKGIPRSIVLSGVNR